MHSEKVHDRLLLSVSITLCEPQVVSNQSFVLSQEVGKENHPVGNP